MSSDIFSKTVYIVELDTLLDTRLGIYKILDYDISSLMKQGYRNRVYDRFENVDYDRYMDIWKNRDKRLLTTATITELPYTLIKEGSANNTNIRSLNPYAINEIWVNVFPYKLNESQKYEIGATMQALFKNTGFAFKVIDKPYKDMTFDWLKDSHVRRLYLYQYEEWVNTQEKSFKESKKELNMTVISPWLITAELTDDTSDMLDSLIEDGKHPPNILKGYFAPYFELALTKSRMFSAIICDDVYPDYIVRDDIQESPSEGPNISS